jgi:hypothetical protein
MSRQKILCFKAWCQRSLGNPLTKNWSLVAPDAAMASKFTGLCA